MRHDDDSRHELVGIEEHIAMTRIAQHLVAADRLRSRVDASVMSPDAADAVIDSRGRVVRVSDVTKACPATDALKQAAAAMDRARTRVRRDRCSVLAIDNRPKCPGVDLLSDRERDVVIRAVAGQHNKAIAYDLGVADSTVRVLLMRAANKVGVRSRRQLIERVAKAFAEPTQRVGPGKP